MQTTIRLNTAIFPAIYKDPDLAWRYAREIHAQSQRLPLMMQAVFRAWLTPQSHEQIESTDIKEIFHWLNSLNPGQAEAEYRLMLLETSWLEMLTQDFYNFLSKDVL